MTTCETSGRINAQVLADIAGDRERFNRATRIILEHVAGCEPTHSFMDHIPPGEGNCALSAMGTLITAGTIEMGEDFQPVLPRG